MEHLPCRHDRVLWQPPDNHYDAASPATPPPVDPDDAATRQP
jgi:hypothetical protein